MDEEQLKRIYPAGKVTETEVLNADWLSLPITQGYFTIEKKDLSDSEIKLLQTLFASKSATGSAHLWYQILFGETAAPSGTFRLLQLKLQAKDFDQQQWEQAVKAAFPAAVDFFAIATDHYLLIEQATAENYGKKVAEGVFLSLDNDFSVTTKVYLGNYSEHTLIKAVFLEEQRLFQWCLTKNSKQRLFTFADQALLYYTQTRFLQSPLSVSLKNTLVLDDELKKIILMLWENQGNISLSAKKLFLHRNTLQYRLDKFYDTYDLNLKKVSDLLLVYLVLVNQTE